MTPTPRSGPQATIWRALVAGLSIGMTACNGGSEHPPRAEFLVAAGDSTYWVRTDGAAIHLRGSPMVMAQLDDRFLELYVVDDDRSFENALFVGQHLYQRDVLTGDSSEVFHDALVPALAEHYEDENPDARPLDVDEAPAEEPATSATSEVSVLAVYGPFISLEYHVDTAGSADDTWHMTRHVVVDLRTGKQASLADVLGPEDAATVMVRARKLYRETVDSVRRDRRPAAQLAARSLNRFRFDSASFSLAAPNGTLMVAFAAPGQGSGGEGFVMPMRPIPVNEPAWWAAARATIPSSTREREELWARPGYSVRATYDTGGRPARLSLLDSTGTKDFPVGVVTPPVHRIYWLDLPAIDRRRRSALTRAFDEAALYDQTARTAHAVVVAGSTQFELASRQ